MTPEPIVLGFAACLLVAAVAVLPRCLRWVERSGPVWTTGTGRTPTVSQVKVWWALILLLPPVILAFLAGVHWQMASQREDEARARQAILGVVAAAPEVLIDGVRVDDATALLDALRGLAEVPAHHSSPTGFVEVELRSGAEVMRLAIARDSSRPAEHWVYLGAGGGGASHGRYAGRISSGALAVFLRRRAF